MDNYIKDVQEGSIIDPGHVREMNMLAFLGNLLVMFTACYYKWLKDGNLKRLGKFRTKSPNEGVVKEMSDFLELIHSLRQERGK